MKKLIIILGVVGVSFSAILVRFSNASSLVLVLYRVFFAALLLFPIVLYRFYGEIKALNKKDMFLCMASGIFLGLHFTMYFESLKYTSIAASVVLVDTEVFFVAIAMLLFFKEKISRSGWVGIVLTFIGSIVIALGDISSGTNVIVGDVIALSGAFCMAVYTIIGTICRQKISTTVYTFIVYLTSAVTVLCLLLISKTPIIGYDPINLVTALAMAIVCTLLGHSIFSWGLKYEKASFISTVKLLEPVFAAMLGFVIFKEVTSYQVLIGGLIVIVGIYWYVKKSE